MKKGDRVIFNSSGEQGNISRILQWVPYMDHIGNHITAYTVKDDSGKEHEIIEESVYPEGSFRIKLIPTWRPSTMAELRDKDPAIEKLAQELHEAGREAVVRGATVAAEQLGQKACRFLEWFDITEQAREGRRIQARWLLRRYDLLPRMTVGGEEALRRGYVASAVDEAAKQYPPRILPSLIPLPPFREGDNIAPLLVAKINELVDAVNAMKEASHG